MRGTCRSRATTSAPACAGRSSASRPPTGAARGPEPVAARKSRADRYRRIGVDERGKSSRHIDPMTSPLAAVSRESWRVGVRQRIRAGERPKMEGTQRRNEGAQALAAPEIAVVPGIAGRWFPQMDEDMPKARVYRMTRLARSVNPSAPRAAGPASSATCRRARRVPARTTRPAVPRDPSATPAIPAGRLRLLLRPAPGHR